MKQSQRGASAEHEQGLRTERIHGANVELLLGALSAFRGSVKRAEKLGLKQGLARAARDLSIALGR
jgi:hypothetical protein